MQQRAAEIIIRADAFNVFNQDNYGLGANMANMSSASLGVNGNSWGRRVITLSGKFVW